MQRKDDRETITSKHRLTLQLPKKKKKVAENVLVLCQTKSVEKNKIGTVFFIILVSRGSTEGSGSKFGEKQKAFCVWPVPREIVELAATGQKYKWVPRSD